MGMDIFGKRPRSKAGKYFRADIFMWGAIHSICDEAIKTSGLPFFTADWSFNDGKGLVAQEHCDLLVGALQRYMKENPPKNGAFRVDNKSCVQNGTNLSVKKSQKVTEFIFEVTDEEMKEFVTFLKNCGGFEIE